MSDDADKPSTDLGSDNWMKILPLLTGLVLGGFGLWMAIWN